MDRCRAISGAPEARGLRQEAWSGRVAVRGHGGSIQPWRRRLLWWRTTDLVAGHLAQGRLRARRAREAAGGDRLSHRAGPLGLWGADRDARAEHGRARSRAAVVRGPHHL